MLGCVERGVLLKSKVLCLAFGAMVRSLRCQGEASYGARLLGMRCSAVSHLRCYGA